jgi:hypothetical protein
LLPGELRRTEAVIIFYWHEPRPTDAGAPSGGSPSGAGAPSGPAGGAPGPGFKPGPGPAGGSAPGQQPPAQEKAKPGRFGGVDSDV